MTVMIPARTVIPVLTMMAIFRVRAFTVSPYCLPAWPARWSVLERPSRPQRSNAGPSTRGVTSQMNADFQQMS